MLTVRHMENPINAEYSVCGTAFDGEDGDDLQVFAKGGEIVTCSLCRAVIHACAAVKRYRIPLAPEG